MEEKGEGFVWEVVGERDEGLFSEAGLRVVRGRGRGMGEGDGRGDGDDDPGLIRCDYDDGGFRSGDVGFIRLRFPRVVK